MNPQSNARRGFCKTLLYIAGGSVVSTGCPDSPATRAELVRFLTDQIVHHDIADRIGKKYLRQVNEPEQLSLDGLVDSLLSNLQLPVNDLSALSLQDLQTRLTRRVHQDFADEKTVIVDGWLLSATEARLCALVHVQRLGS